MNEQPLISVIIPTYNRRSTIKRAIDSVLQQTWKNFEIIIVDDCSTDDTFAFVQRQYGALNNLIYVINEQNCGAGESRNIGVSYANGEYIAFHDSDDEWTPNKLELQMHKICNPESPGIAVYSVFSRQWKSGTDQWPSHAIPMEYRSGNVYPFLLLTPLVGIITLLMRKDVFIELGGFNSDLHSLEDYEFTIRLAQKYSLDYIDTSLATAYESEDSVGKRNDAKIMTECYILAFHYESLKKFGLLHKKMEAIYEDAQSFGCIPVFLETLSDVAYPECQDYYNKLLKYYKPSNHPQTPTPETIAAVKDCCGCLSCVNSCPQQAITAQYSSEGFLYPVISPEKCIKCGICVNSCPLCNEVYGSLIPEKCYVAMAHDDLRLQASSGGIFPLLANYFLEHSGYIAGAIFDEQFHVKHIITNSHADAQKMFSSKYVQSDLNNIFPETLNLLRSGELVVFSGCACQIAALKQYLHLEYDNLYTVDVVCHGVPSPGIWENYLSEKSPISNISFRDKKNLGWSSGLYIEYQDGTSEIATSSQDPYMFTFSNNWTLRPSCYECHFKNKKYSDITLGDFWGINQFSSFDDGLGSSFVSINTSKGAHIFNQIIKHIQKSGQTKTSTAAYYNPCIERAVPYNKCRDLFFQNYRSSSLKESIRAAIRQLHFDVALIYMWAPNYGNALTNYALYHYLSSTGCKVLALDNFSPLRPQDKMLEFAQKQYCLSSLYYKDYDTELLNMTCECFLVGSDQNWNYLYEPFFGYGQYFYLDFVAEGHHRLSYATSFGQPEGAIPSDIGKPLYQSFDAISVREDFGVQLCHDLYGVDATRVVDPVFLLSPHDYQALAHQSKCRETGPFILAYILNPTPEKRQLCLEIQQELGNIPIINIIDCNPQNETFNRRMLDYENIKFNISVEDFLYYMINAEFILTDSYHGTCFSLIFQKPFVTCLNREKHRFETFKKYPDVSRRIIDENHSHDITEWIQLPDYSEINSILEREIEISKDFLKQNLNYLKGEQ